MAMDRNGSEDEVRGLNALGNPDTVSRGGIDRGPEGEGRIGQPRPGGILARGTASSFRRGMGGAAEGGQREITPRSSSR